ncbi:PLP-dependent aminotransferase family protein [Marininema halotolerans]|uniref:GntR family transcriptional regulator / MocR family aminotransferase n=1 Tax=Marininema halotolerans TaxID=1155944 RepID=A0A1I6RHB7_9BACL|nr:PLP-dependent aminotransferase family protein [Marininema halotolerans]SFS64107.1 GntR family transcriptional regulator / MocR family aminotransferase [Marininema halotolerans]
MNKSLHQLTPHLDRGAPTPLYQQLYTYLKHEIETGRLPANYRLPSKRKWSHYLKISLTTMENAYHQLHAEGYVMSRPRKGLFVAPIDKSLHLVPPTAPSRIASHPRTTRSNDIHFHYGSVDFSHFPYEIWSRLTRQVLRKENFPQEIDPFGDFSLRQEIAHYLYTSRGVSASAEQVVVGPGTQSLIRWISQLIGVDKTYAIEDPGYHRAKTAFTNMGVTYRPVPLDEDGIHLRSVEQNQADVVYVTPSHQFPTGIVMPFARRQALLAWSTQGERWIFEDDYDSEFRYKGQPIPSLQGMDRNQRVIYLGAFSKSILNELRLSYAVLPFPLLDRAHQHQDLEKLDASRINQLTLHAFMEQGHWQRHLNRMRTLYRKKHRTLIETIKNTWNKSVTIIGQDAGLHLLIQVHSAHSEEDLVAMAHQAGVRINPLSDYCSLPSPYPDPVLLLGYGGLSEDEIREGIRRLQTAWSLSLST